MQREGARAGATLCGNRLRWNLTNGTDNLLECSLSEAIAFELDHSIYRQGQSAHGLLVAAAEDGRISVCRLTPEPSNSRLYGPGEIAAVCLHPGMVATGIGQRGGLVELGWRAAKPFMISPEKGAESSIFLATVPDPGPFHGGYVIDKTLARPDPLALDDGLARRLWDESARLVGL